MNRNTLPSSTFGAAGAGVTFVQTPAHPWAGADGEYWMQFSGSTADHRLENMGYGVNVDEGFSTPPDSTKRWGQCHQFLWRHGVSAGVGDSDPTSNATILSNSGLTAYLKYNTDRTWSVIFNGVTTTSAATTATLTNYLIEVWMVYNY